MTQFLQLTTTVAERADAELIAKALVEWRLAGCVQISGPITSTYWWQGKVETAEEWLCQAKTRSDKFEAIAKLLAELHPYDVPELIATPISEIGAAYARWLDEQLDA